jgi:hypothetical protein
MPAPPGTERVPGTEPARGAERAVLIRPPFPSPPDAAEPGRSRPGARETATARFVISGLSLASLAIGAVAYTLGADQVRALGLLTFCLLGVGSAPWQLSAALRLPARLAMTVLTGIGTFTLVPMLMIATHAWHPAVAFVVVAAVCAALHVAGAVLAANDARAGTTGADAARRPLVRSPAVVLAVLGALLCFGAALTHRHIDPGVAGFLPRIGPLWYAGLVLILLGLLSAGDEDERRLVIPVVVLLLIITLTPALVYDGPRSQSAAKHVDLVQQIRTLHRPNSAVLVYNAWSGFFAAMAWLADITGIRDPLGLAAFWPPLVGVLRLAALRYFFGQVLSGAYRCWAAISLVVLVDSLGQDYFSPQSVGLVVGLVAYGLALSRRTGWSRPALLLAAGCVLAVSHQLSPYIVGGVLVVLVTFRQVRPWWTPLLVLGPAGLWTLLHRSGVSQFVKLNSIGQLQNFRPPKLVGSPGLHRLPIVGATVDALLVALVVLGTFALIGLLHERRRLRAWAIVCCPTVGLALVAINPYGHEGIFRATVFGIPWLALLAVAWLPAQRRLRARLPLVAAIAIVTPAFLIATFGLDGTNVSRASDVAAFRFLQAEARAEPGRMHYPLQLGGGDLPGPVARWKGNYWPVGRDDIGADPVREEPAPFDADRQVARLTARLLRYSGERLGAARLYTVWSPVDSEYDYEYALQLPDQFAALRDAFLRSPYWEMAFRRDGTYVFRFVPTRYQVGAP